MSSKGTLSSLSSVGRTSAVALLAGAIVVGSLTVAPSRADAQCAPDAPLCSRVSPDGKGIVGLGLIGAELGFVIPALVQNAAGTNEWWPYLVFPVVGAAAGVVGGYFMEQETQASPEIDVAFLVAGLALVVPTVVATLALTAYEPGQGSGGDLGEPEPEPRWQEGTTTDAIQVEGGDEFGDEPVEGGGESEAAPATSGEISSVERRSPNPLAGGPGILRFDGAGRQLLLGMPLLQTRSSYTAAERESLRLVPSTDVHVPVVSATF